MMWTDRAFGIWMGDAGKDLSRSADEAASIDVQAFERTLITSDVHGDVPAAPRAGALVRAISALAARTQLSRIARG